MIAAAGVQHDLGAAALCSANRDKYAAFDTPSTEWRATDLTPDADGKYTFNWESTAPHETLYYQLYLTKEGFDPTQPLAPRTREREQQMRRDLVDEEMRTDVGALMIDMSGLALLPDGLSRKLGARPFTISVRFPEDEEGHVMKETET